MKRPRRLPPSETRALDPFSAGPAAAPEPAAEESPFAIFHKVHRLLRGRYHWAIGLGLVGAIAGSIGGYMATKPLYQSVGTIHIMSVLPTVLDTVRPLQNHYMHVRTRANLLQDPRVLDAAFNSEAWRRLGRENTAAAREKFRKSLRVVVEREDPEWIYIRFIDRDPIAAKVAVEEIISAYVERHGAIDNIATPLVLQTLQGLRAEHENKIRSLQDQINAIGSRQHGTNDLTAHHTDALELLRRLEAQLTALDWEISEVEHLLSKGDAAAASESPRIPYHEIAQHDPVMRGMLLDQMRYQAELESKLTRLTPQHRDVLRVKSQLDAHNTRLEEHARQWLAQSGGFIPGALLSGSVTPERLEQVRADRAALVPQAERAHRTAQELSDKRLEIERLREEIKAEQIKLAEVQHRLRVLTTEPTTVGGTSPRLNIVSRGELEHSPAVDHRKKLAALGLAFGGGLPVGLIMLLGLLDRRFRYAEEADATGKVTLLGVLPYLPDAARDPEQASVAAHCVHQIRTLLQIAAAGQARKVFAITSPTAGDGKTSLSLSLGLSFAASGARTCLIDFDMIGAGLTAAMQVKTDLGLLDAIEQGHLNGHVRTTSFSRLSLIPVGEHDAREVSRLSPAAVRRVLDQAREEFDIVIVDTGPILGSIEAALVCAEADGVVMAIGRGQQRPIAERAINHLGSIGARLMGVVFNRADAADFRRTIASTSMRSVPVQNGQARSVRRLPALGPMANSLATQAEEAE
jgi:polysaccharide biosynthesis transport protein